MVTTDMNISYIAAAPADREVEVEAKLLQQGETVTVSVDLRDRASQKFVAQGRISMRLSSHPLSKL
jgi:acyl-coenzyme A thioesterase PaaI-like protein